MDNVLVLVRHGQSEWNKLNLFTGWKDPGLTDKGVEEAISAGKRLKAEGLQFDLAYTSNLGRAQRTLELMLKELDQTGLDTTKNEALNERDYGDLAGLNKDDAREKWGEAQVHIWRRSYDVPPPGGESLKDTKDRVIPYYTDVIWPTYKSGKNIIVSAHGNSLRAMVMQLEGLTPEEIMQREISTGQPIIYHLNEDGTVQSVKDFAAKNMA